jgi:hypothetical protein
MVSLDSGEAYRRWGPPVSIHYNNGRRSALTGLSARDTLDFMRARQTTIALLLMASLAACGGYGDSGDGEDYGPTGPSNPAPPADTETDSSGEGDWDY